VGKVVSNWLRNLIEKVLKNQNVEVTLIEFAGSAVYYGLMAVVLLSAISNLGIQTTSFMAILGAAGLAVGLALKDTLSNIGSAVVLLVFRPFKVGDYISAGGAEGVVDIHQCRRCGGGRRQDQPLHHDDQPGRQPDDHRP